jgi:hypothetical protein
MTDDKINNCKLTMMRLTSSFFAKSASEKLKNKKEQTDMEFYDDCILKVNFLPSDCFKILIMPRGNSNWTSNLKGGFLIISTYAIYYLEMIKNRDELIKKITGFLVNINAQTLKEVRESYYKCAFSRNLNHSLICKVNNNPNSQINLRNFKFEFLDASTILLAGVGLYLLKMKFKKDLSLESIELNEISEQATSRFSFLAAYPKLTKDKHNIIMAGSYMTNSHLLELELLSEPQPDLMVSKKVHTDEEYQANYQQIKEITYILTVK